MQVSSELLGTAYSFDCQFEALPNIWVSLDVTVNEAYSALQTGLIRNKPITKIKMFAITADTSSVSFVYDVVASKQGNFPWTLQTN